jgi:hypothetical protein
MTTKVHLDNTERLPLCGARPTNWDVAQNVDTCTCRDCLGEYIYQEESAWDRARTNAGRAKRAHNAERAMDRFNALRGEEDQ